MLVIAGGTAEVSRPRIVLVGSQVFLFLLIVEISLKSHFEQHCRNRHRVKQARPLNGCSTIKEPLLGATTPERGKWNVQLCCEAGVSSSKTAPASSSEIPPLSSNPPIFR